MRFGCEGRGSARGLTSVAGGCLRRRRCGAPVVAAWRWCRRLPGWRVRRSIAVKTTSTASRFAKGRVRRAGGGRRAVSENDPGLVPALRRLVEPATLGDPMRPLIWVSKSMAKLAAALTEMGHPISADTVGAELAKLGFSRQSNRKADEGSRIEKACAHGRSSLSRPIESSLVNKR